MLAAVLTGAGECLLYLSVSEIYANGGQDVPLLDVSDWRLTWGDLLCVLGAPLYVVGMWHIYLGLKPFSQMMALTLFLVGSFGFVVGSMWTVVAAALLAQAQVVPPIAALTTLTDYYARYSELVVMVVRITMLLTSLGYIAMVLTGKTVYPRWMAVFSPFVLAIVSLLVFVIIFDLGIYALPIAENVAYFLFFALSTMLLASRCKHRCAVLGQ